MFDRFKKFFNSKQSRPTDRKDLTLYHAQLMVSCCDIRQGFIGYRAKLIVNKERPDLCQIIMNKDGYTAVRAFEKLALYDKDTVTDVWEVLLLPHLLKCKEYIDKQMKQPFIEFMYNKFMEERCK